MFYRIISSLSQEQVEDIITQFEKELAKQANGTTFILYMYK